MSEEKLNNELIKEKCQPDKKIKPLSPVQKAARLMGKSVSFVHIGLQRGILPFGSAIQGEKGQWSYYISPKQFKEFTGKDLEVDLWREN